MTTSTTDTAADEVRERQAAHRARVLNAAIMSDRAFAERNDADQFSVSLAITAAMMELAQVWREEAEYFTTAKRRGWKSTADQLTQAAARLAGFAQGLPNIVSTGTLVITPGEVAAAGMVIVDDPISPREAFNAQVMAIVNDPDATAVEKMDALGQVCSHPDDQRSTLKSGVIMCTLCSAAVGQAEQLAELVPGTKRGPVVTGDATLDYLSGATDTYAPRPLSPSMPGDRGYREAEHGRPQAPCFECLGADESPAPWCDCIPGGCQPCKGPCRRLAHAWTFHPQGCTHRARTNNPDPTRCLYCLADLSAQNFHGITANDLQGSESNPERVERMATAWGKAIDPSIASSAGLGGVNQEEGIELVTVIPTSPSAPTVVTPAVDNPFTSPAAPGTNRAPVKRLTYGELGPLVAATYPVPRPHLSHSYVESIGKCGLSALLSDASRAGHLGPRRPSWSLIGGNAFHAAVEAIERVSISIGGADPATAAQTPNWEEFWEEALTLQVSETSAELIGTPYANPSTWHVANKGLENYDWWRVQGLDMVLKYLALHDTAWRSRHTLLQVPALPSDTRVPVLELPFTVNAGSSAIAMEGRIDVAWLATTDEYPTAALEVVDFKAGKSLPVDHFQLVEYGDVLRKHLPSNFGLPIVGRHYRARLGTYTPPVPLPAKPGSDEIDYRYQAAQRAMKHAVFAPHVDNMCSSCGSVDFCPAQSMRDGATS